LPENYPVKQQLAIILTRSDVDKRMSVLGKRERLKFHRNYLQSENT
jgi:L-rhamnose isomerase